MHNLLKRERTVSIRQVLPPLDRTEKLLFAFLPVPDASARRTEWGARISQFWPLRASLSPNLAFSFPPRSKISSPRAATIGHYVLGLAVGRHSQAVREARTCAKARYMAHIHVATYVALARFHHSVTRASVRQPWTCAPSHFAHGHVSYEDLEGPLGYHRLVGAPARSYAQHLRRVVALCSHPFVRRGRDG